jgi:hypothetical protein
MVMLPPFMVQEIRSLIDADLYNPKYDNVPYAMSERAKKQAVQ